MSRTDDADKRQLTAIDTLESLTAVGLLVRLRRLSEPITVADLAARYSDSLEDLQEGLDELSRLGYVARDENGAYSLAGGQ